MTKAFLLSSTLAAALVCTAPGIAAAATVTEVDGPIYLESFATTLSSNVTEYIFKANSDYVWNFSFTSNGAKSALEQLTFSINGGAWQSYLLLPGKTAFIYKGEADAGPINGQLVTVSFKYDGIIDVVARDFTASTIPVPAITLSVDAVSAVPLPAAGLGLIAALGGLGLVSRRRQKA